MFNELQNLNFYNDFYNAWNPLQITTSNIHVTIFNYKNLTTNSYFKMFTNFLNNPDQDPLFNDFPGSESQLFVVNGIPDTSINIEKPAPSSPEKTYLQELI